MSRIQLTPDLMKMLMQGIRPEGLGIRFVPVVRRRNTVHVRLEVVADPNGAALAIIGEQTLETGNSITIMDIAQCFKIQVGNGYVV
jgi:hypothetical protein